MALAGGGSARGGRREGVGKKGRRGGSAGGFGGSLRARRGGSAACFGERVRREGSESAGEVGERGSGGEVGGGSR